MIAIDFIQSVSYKERHRFEKWYSNLVKRSFEKGISPPDADEALSQYFEYRKEKRKQWRLKQKFKKILQSVPFETQVNDLIEYIKKVG